MKNKKINKNVIDNLISIGGIILVIIIFGMFIRGISIDAYLSENDICKCYYGENYIYENDPEFGRSCVELNYENHTKANYKKFNWSLEEMSEMYDKPGFWELDKWSSEFNCEVGK